MRPVSKTRRRPERDIQDDLRADLIRAGWTIAAKTHGNCFQPGWPDLFIFSPEHGHRWLEVKTPRGALTPPQRSVFACWTAAGEGVWVLDGPDFRPLFGPPNWTDWLTGPQRAHFEDRRAFLCRHGPRHTEPKDWL